jgi:hypothetical protein
VALGVAGGYFLGRTKKMKLALMFAGMAAGRRAGGPGELLKSGTKLLGSTPELAQLTDQVRGRLLEAGKSAALAVAARQVESLTDRVGKRVESLGDVGLPRQRASEKPADEPEEEPAARDEHAEDEVPADEIRDDDRDESRDEAPAEDEAPPVERRTARARARTSSGTGTARRTAGGAARAAGTAGKTGTGRRSTRTPRTRRTEGDG